MKRSGKGVEDPEDEGIVDQTRGRTKESRSKDSQVHANKSVSRRRAPEDTANDEGEGMNDSNDEDDDDDDDEDGDAEGDEEEDEDEAGSNTQRGSLASSERAETANPNDSIKKVSCQPCRVAKVRCQPSTTSPSAPCARCEKLSKECVYRVHKRGRKPGKIKFQQILRRLEILDKTLKEIEALNQDVGDVDADSLVKTLSWQLHRSKFFSNHRNVSINTGGGNGGGGGAKRRTSQVAFADDAKREEIKMEQIYDFGFAEHGAAGSGDYPQHHSTDPAAQHRPGRTRTEQSSTTSLQRGNGGVTELGNGLRRDHSQGSQSLATRERQSEGLFRPPSFPSTSPSTSASTTRSGSLLLPNHIPQRRSITSAPRASEGADIGSATEDGASGLGHRDDPSSRTDYNMLVDMEDQASVSRVPDEFHTLSNPLKLLAQASTEERNRRRLQEQSRFDPVTGMSRRRSGTGSMGSKSVERDSRRSLDYRSTSRSEKGGDRDVEGSDLGRSAGSRRKRMRSSSVTADGRREENQDERRYDRERNHTTVGNEYADMRKRQRAFSMSSTGSTYRDGADNRQHRLSLTSTNASSRHTQGGAERQGNDHPESHDTGSSSASSSSWATTYFSRGAFHPVYDNRQDFDPIDCGLITFSQATRLITQFYQNFGNFIHIFDPHLSTITYIRKHSAFLLTVLCSISAEFETSQDAVQCQESSRLAVSLKGHYELLMQHITKNGEYKNVEMAQAFFLLAQYKELSENAQRDQTWFFLSTAIRIATELGCNLCCYSYSTPQSRDAVSSKSKGSAESTTGPGSSPNKISAIAEDAQGNGTAAQGSSDGTMREHYQRQLRNTERLWINLYNFEKTLASMTGQRFHLNDHEGVIATCSNWHTMQYSLAQDEVLIAQTELRRLLARKSDWFSVNIVRCLENKFLMTISATNKSKKKGNKGGEADDNDGDADNPQRMAQQEQLSLQLNYFRTSVDTDLRRWEEKWLSTPLTTSSASSMTSFTTTPASSVSTSTPSTTTTSSSGGGPTTPTPLQIIAYLTLHYSALITYALPLPIKYTVDVGEELTNLYRNCYISATNYMVCFIERSSQHLMDHITNSLVVSTVYCVVFSLDLVRKKNLQVSGRNNRFRGGTRGGKAAGGWVDFGFVSSKRVLNLARLTAQELKKIGNARPGRQGKSVGGRFAEFLETVLERVDADAEAGMHAPAMHTDGEDDRTYDHDDAQGQGEQHEDPSDERSAARHGKGKATLYEDDVPNHVGGSDPNQHAHLHANQNRQQPQASLGDGQIGGSDARSLTVSGFTGTTASHRHSSHAHFSSSRSHPTAPHQNHHPMHHHSSSSSHFGVQAPHFLHPMHNSHTYPRQQQQQQVQGGPASASTSMSSTLDAAGSHRDAFTASHHPVSDSVAPNDAHWFSTAHSLPSHSEHTGHHGGNDPTTSADAALNTDTADLVLDDKQWEWMMKDLSFFNHVDGGDPIMDQLGRLFG